MTSADPRAQALGRCAGARIRHDVTETGHEPECVMLDVQLIRKGRWTRSPARATGAVPARELVEEQSRRRQLRSAAENGRQQRHGRDSVGGIFGWSSCSAQGMVER